MNPAVSHKYAPRLLLSLALLAASSNTYAQRGSPDAAPSHAAPSHAVPTHADAQHRSADEVPNRTKAAQAAPFKNNQDQGKIQILHRSAENIKIGEPLHLRVHVELPEHAQLLSLRPAGNPYVERIHDLRRAAALRSGLAVTVFRPGTYKFTLEAAWIDSEGQPHSTHSDPLRLHVAHTVTDHDHATLAPPGPYLTLRSRNIWLIGAGITSILALLSLLGWWTWRRFHPQHPVDSTPPPPPRPAWEIALEEIHDLRADSALLANDAVQFHHRTSDILRTWLQGRFKLRALEMTTEEILDDLSSRWLVLGEWIERIHTILVDTDLVKFAKFSASADDSLTLLRQLEELVRDVQASDASPLPDIPAPIEGDEPPIKASEHAAPQVHAPGVGTPRYTPKDIQKPTILSLDFRGSNAPAPKPPASEQAPEGRSIASRHPHTTPPVPTVPHKPARPHKPESEAPHKEEP